MLTWRPHTPEPIFYARSVSTAVHFYQNRQLEAYASKPATRMTLRQLVRVRITGASGILDKGLQVFFGRSMNEERLIKVRVRVPANGLMF